MRYFEQKMHIVCLWCIILLVSHGKLTESCKYSSSSESDVIFYDEFDTLDLATWQHEITTGGGGNNEFQYYTNNRSNSYVRDGVLYIKPTLTEDKYDANFIKYGTLSLEGTTPANSCTGRQWYGCERTANYDGSGAIINPIQSARLRTVNSFSFRYGKVEIEAKLPTGDWIWPAIWLLPTYNHYGDWPASGEIDIMEARGNVGMKDAAGNSIGPDSVGSTLHWGPYWPFNAWYLTHDVKVLEGKSFADDFHKFGLEWTEQAIKCFVDDELILNVEPPNEQTMYEWADFETETFNSENPWRGGTALAPFDQEFYLVLNVAVGGTTGFFPDEVTNPGGDKPWKNDSPTAAKDFWDKKEDWFKTWDDENSAMKIRYVKVSRL